mmetsp:Transcript_24218/g.40575  ORF Transcript_24218/g.40575 Transcript_24218/m.40575 type:complete len:133 (+) Transcript_24218:286-684(+)
MAPNLSNAAPKLGFLANLSLVAVGLIAVIMGNFGIGLYVLLVGIVITPLEAPIICKCVPQLSDLMRETFKMNNWIVRGIFYILLTVLMFLGDVVTIVGGVTLFMSGIMYIAAQAQGLREPEAVEPGESLPIV